jgi:ribonuclease D
MTDHSEPSPSLTSALVQDSAALHAVVERCLASPAVAVDTEFVWTNTFYPRLGLIQLGISPEDVWLVDNIAIGDISPLAPLLMAENVVKIFHDPEMDLPILARSVGCQTTNVFDTRLAAGFAGFPSILSLARLIQEFFGVELPKTQTRTDWCHRPLTPHQLAYALDDVRYMPELRERLIGQIRERGNEAWMKEEMVRYEPPGQLVEPDPEELFRNVKGMGRLAPAQLAVLQKVIAWREEAARRLDLPRRRVLSDEAAIVLARRQPRDAKSIQKLECVARRTARDHAEELVAAIAEGSAMPAEQWPRLGGSPIDSKTMKTHADAILETVRQAAGKRDVDPAIVTSRRDANQLVIAQARGQVDGHPLRSGWRAELLGQDLDPVLLAVPRRG